MLSPELLQPQTELVDCLLEQTKNMEENLMAISKSDFRFALHRMEVWFHNMIVLDYVVLKKINFRLRESSL